MATETSLNQIVKGAPPPDTKVPSIAPLPSLASASSETVALVTHGGDRKTSKDHTPTPSIADPALSALPSSPPQIYLNLLILEASLRSQYLHLLARRRLNTFFLLLLGLWNGFFVWALFLRPREDGQGHGGSVYWVVETGERLAFMGGVVAALLVQATGQWERGIRWPRRWLGTTNRGLRGFNLRVVVVKGKWWKEMFSIFAFLLPFGSWRGGDRGSDWHLVEHESGVVVEEDLSKGGDHIMLLPLPKNFSSEFRENWEIYRNEYWEKENDKRATYRRKVHSQRRSKAKEKGGWKWWTGCWRLAGLNHNAKPSGTVGNRGGLKKGHDLEKHPHPAGRHTHSNSFSEKDVLAKASRRRSIMRDGSHSRQSSRGSTYTFPAIDIDGNPLTELSGKPLKERVRRGSSVSSTSSVRRNTKSSGGGGGIGSSGTANNRREGMLSPLTAADSSEPPSPTTTTTTTREKRSTRREKDRENAKATAAASSDARTNDSRPTTPNSDSESFTSSSKHMSIPA